MEHEYLNMINICMFCGLVNPEEDHVINQHTNKLGFGKCCFCSLEFKESTALIQHIRIHNRGHIKCVYCRKRFSNYESFIAHMLLREDHSFYRCSNFDCYYSTDKEKDIFLHTKNHVLPELYIKIRKTKDLRFLCPDPKCTFASKNKSVVKNHVEYHVGKKDFQCLYCSFGSKSYVCTNDHMNNCHKSKSK